MRTKLKARPKQNPEMLPRLIVPLRRVIRATPRRIGQYLPLTEMKMFWLKMLTRQRGLKLKTSKKRNLKWNSITNMRR